MVSEDVVISSSFLQGAMGMTKSSVWFLCSWEDILKTQRFDFQLLFVIDVTVINAQGRHVAGVDLSRLLVSWFQLGLPGSVVSELVQREHHGRRGGAQSSHFPAPSLCFRASLSAHRGK